MTVSDNKDKMFVDKRNFHSDFELRARRKARAFCDPRVFCDQSRFLWYMDSQTELLSGKNYICCFLERKTGTANLVIDCRRVFCDTTQGIYFRYSIFTWWIKKEVRLWQQILQCSDREW